jgi:ATP-binding cassette subfamily B protein
MTKKGSKFSGAAVDLSLLRRIFAYVRPYRMNFALAVITTITLAFLSPLRPYLVKYTFDNFITVPDPAGVNRMILLMVILLFAEAGIQFADAYLTNRLGQSIIRDLRSQLFRHIIRLRLKYYDNSAIGTLVTRAVSDIEGIAEIFSQGLIVIIGDILKLVVILGAMMWMNYKLTLIILIPIPFLLLATWLFKRAVAASFQQVRTQVARLNAFTQEHITGMNIVQVFNREKAEMEKFREINALHRDANIRSILAYAIFFPVVEILSAASLALLVWWGGRGILDGFVEIGDLMMFILFIHQMFRPIRQLADRFNTLQMGMVSSERVFKVLDTDEMISDDGTLPASDLTGNIEFRNVWFAYNDQDWVIKDLSFEVTPGQTVALVGATGAGKSSVINLLSRFYEYNKGEILIDGKNVRSYELASLRRNVGVVPQDVFLFSDSIAANISLNDPLITRERMIDAAKQVGAHDFISSLPGDYDFNVKERGGMLSMGQRQLIAFIRAYVYDPRILVLDEATSSVDTESEHLIQKAISVLTEGRTSVVIAHRLATIQKADKIIVMDKGEIIESGNHQELLQLNGAYKKLFELQFSEQN